MAVDTSICQDVLSYPDMHQLHIHFHRHDNTKHFEMKNAPKRPAVDVGVLLLLLVLDQWQALYKEQQLKCRTRTRGIRREEFSLTKSQSFLPLHIAPEYSNQVVLYMP